MVNPWPSEFEHRMPEDSLEQLTPPPASNCPYGRAGPLPKVVSPAQTKLAHPVVPRVMPWP